MTKNQIVEKAMNLVGVAPAESLLIGDSANDAESAAQLGIPFIGVTYGYGSEQELLETGAERIARTPAEILDVL